MKLFDDIFRRNVDKAFSNYNADHLADEGWNSFMAARKAGRRRKAVILLWTRAASVALIVGTGALIGYLTINHKHAEDSVSVSGSESKKEVPATVQSKSSVPALSAIKKEVPAKVQSKSSVPALPVVADIAEPSLKRSKEKLPSNTPAEAGLEMPPGTARPAEGFTPVHISTTILHPVAENRFLPSTDSLNHAFEEAQRKFEQGKLEDTIIENTGKRSGKTILMAGLSGLVTNVGNAASTSPGVAAGFYLEQKITKRISLRPGLALAMNSVGIDNKSGVYSFASLIPLSDGNSGTLTSGKGQLNLFAMELPLNVVFKVYNKGRSGISLSAGTSTMIYFSQEFAGDFVNRYTQDKYDAETNSMSTETRYSSVSVKNSYGTLRHTDFFGLASFSAGYSLPYGRTGAILIEPFMQLPVRELTALDLRVHYGGISVKVCFGNKEP